MVSKMKYYELRHDVENDHQDYILNIKEKELTFNRYDAYEKTRISANKIICHSKNKNYLNYEHLWNNMLWSIVSERVKDILNEINIGECEFIPVYDVNDNENLVGYLLHCMNFVNAFDKINSEYSTSYYFHKWKINKSVIVCKYALLEKRIKDFDIFKLEKYGLSIIFVSERFKNLMEKYNVKGFAYTEVKVR